MKVSSIQFQIKDDETKDQRLNRMAEMIKQCKGSNLIILPEIWNTGYFNFENYQAESEDIDGKTLNLMAGIAKELQSYILMGSIVEKHKDSLFNTSFLLNPDGKVIATYRKIHLFGFGSEETKILSRGSEVVTVKTEFGVIGIATCYDLRFPEMFRKMLDQGVQFILVSSAWPYPRLDHWRLLNQARALENQCYLISSNCSGTNKGKQYLGHSAIVDPWGIVISGAGDEETIITAEINSSEVERIRSIFPPVNDRILR